MKTKSKFLITFNIIFYLLILFNIRVVKIYGTDYILQALIYIILSFSTVVMEEVFREKINELKIISVIDFIARIVTLGLHFLWIYFSFNDFIIKFIISILCVLNILIEIYLIKKSKKINDKKVEVINDKEYKEFINKFYNNKLDNHKCGLKINREIKDIMNIIQISGKVNLVCILLFIGLFISRFIYTNFVNLIFLDYILISILLIIFININSKLIRISLKKGKKIRRKIVLENIIFVVGYIILFVCEVILQGKIENIRVSIWVLSIITFIPFFNRKYKIKEEFKKVYKEYSNIVE